MPALFTRQASLVSQRIARSGIFAGSVGGEGVIPNLLEAVGIRSGGLFEAEADVDFVGRLWSFEASFPRLDQFLSSAQRESLESLIGTLRKTTPKDTGRLARSWEARIGIRQDVEPAPPDPEAVFFLEDRLRRSGGVLNSRFSTPGVGDVFAEVRSSIRNRTPYATVVERGRGPTFFLKNREEIEAWVRRTLNDRLKIDTARFRDARVAREAAVRRAVFGIQRKLARRGYEATNILANAIEIEIATIFRNMTKALTAFSREINDEQVSQSLAARGAVVEESSFVQTGIARIGVLNEFATEGLISAFDFVTNTFDPFVGV